jgi:nitrogen fixation protein NifU and related proteins
VSGTRRSAPVRDLAAFAADGPGGLAELYGEVILDHNRRPRNFGRLQQASHTAVGHNPLCGDKVAVALRVEDGRIEEIAFEGVGCAISTASASMMTEALRGKTVEEARQLFERFHALLTVGSARPPAAAAGPGDPPGREGGSGPGDPGGEPGDEPGGGPPVLGKLAAFAGVREFPMRVKCATLAWHTMHSALAAPPAATPVTPAPVAGRPVEQG